jgi:hypothetical protein
VPSDNHVKRPAIHEPERQAARIRTVVRIVRKGFAAGDDRVHGIRSYVALKHALNQTLTRYSHIPMEAKR